MAVAPAARRAARYAAANRDRFIEELTELVRFPSVSAQRRHAADVAACAGWLARHLRRLGLDAAVAPTGGHPIVWGEWRRAPDRPTVMVYGHYDVQPAEPLGEWRSPPFAPEVRGGRLYGRGASDDKGQVFAHLKAIEAWLATSGRLPVNVCCLVEGEEEIGSLGLPGFLRRLPRRPDVVVVSDAVLAGPGRPALTYALRGHVAVELEVVGPAGELHAGTFGGAVANPLEALCGIVAGLHDAAGRVAVRGFYDAVRPVSPAERRYLREQGAGEAALLAADGRATAGEPGYTPHERTVLRPALTVSGMGGGYQGEGPKAVIPARASAKIGVRLVPDQDPLEVEAQLRRHVAGRAPRGVRVELRRTAAPAPPVVLDVRGPAARAAMTAYRRGFGRPAVLTRSGGTIPVVGLASRTLGAPVLVMGFAGAGDNHHGPNESLDLGGFGRAVATSCHLLAELAGALAC